MHSESYHVSEDAAERINSARKRGGRVIAVGTTSLRALEGAAAADGTLRPGSGMTSLFVRPGWRFRVVSGLVTNFHLPRSSLLALTAAVVGRERILAAYREAVAEGYRFYSYGDATLLFAGANSD